MIAGYPLSLEAGFLHQAIQNLESTGDFQVTFEVVAMGGFSVPRAHKHFAKKVLSHRPDIVVLQFGSTDASAPLRNNIISRRKLHKGSHSLGKVPALPPTSRDVWKWRLRSLASGLMRVPPLTPLDLYLEAMLGMAEECQAAGSRAVVVSPFIMGSGHSDRFARRYAQALKNRLLKSPQVQFLDAYALLSPWPRRQMLLQDGFHLSAEAHQKVGAALAGMLAEIARDNRLNPAGQTP